MNIASETAAPRRAWLASLLLAAGLLPALPTAAADAAVLLAPADMQWQPWGILQRIVLFGRADDFDCPYVDRIRLPAGFKVPSHGFQQDKVFTVLSGVVSVGIGDNWDEAGLKRLPAGSFWRIPAGVRYYFRSEGEAVLQTQVGAVPGRVCPSVDTEANPAPTKP